MASRWAVVLAAGDGTRLRALTTREGVAVPKQFCSLAGGPSLLGQALHRARRLVRTQRIRTVVAEAHRHWWRPQLAGWAAAGAVVQPGNRGTAAGVILPLLSIAERDPDATILVVPSDHHVEDESVLARVADRALARAEATERIVLLGIRPDGPDPGFGWILPGEPRTGGLRAVAGFVEKPPAVAALRLLVAGGLWNSFLLAFRAAVLLERCRELVPEVIEPLEAGRSSRARLRAAYRHLPARDFSRDLLQRSVTNLELLAVPHCGWSDLGTPERVAACLRTVKTLGGRPRTLPAFPPAALDLGLAYRSLAVGT